MSARRVTRRIPHNRDLILEVPVNDPEYLFAVRMLGMHGAFVTYVRAPDARQAMWRAWSFLACASETAAQPVDAWVSEGIT